MDRPADPYRIFAPGLDAGRAALELFRFQAVHNPVYRSFVSLQDIEPASVNSVSRIPFLPVSLFRSQDIVTEGLPVDGEAALFFSSGTTGSARSRHRVADLHLYRTSLRAGFLLRYGEPSEYVILALIPPEARERGSSLAFMADELIAHSGHPDSGYRYGDPDALAAVLQRGAPPGRRILLIGLTWALMDFAAWLGNHPFRVTGPSPVIMETGGMKGRRKEMVREEVHAVLCRAFGVDAVHSEYGMTELLSQAYSPGRGLFRCPPWMQVLIRDVNDPFARPDNGRTGGIDIVDLANAHSCAFIATQDLGRLHGDGSFEVLGRFDNSDLRGCNLMVE